MGASISALLVVDVQNDFCEGGALPVPGGQEVVPLINKLTSTLTPIVFTQDWHPPHHISFASSHHRAPFDSLDLPYGTQTLYPDHCLQGNFGAQFHKDLTSERAHLILRKGHRRDMDSYSAFYENNRTTPTGLEGYLRTQGVRQVVVAGLALDVCVLFTVCDALKLGFEVMVVEDACRGLENSEEALKHMERHGAQHILAEHLLSHE